MKSLCFLFSLFIIASTVTNAQWFPQISGTTEDINDVHFVNTSLGWACGDDGKIIKTTNSGFNWFDQNPSTSVSLKNISFVDPNNGWTCGGNQLFRTTDGGLTWSSYSFSTGSSVIEIQFVNESTGWVIINSSNLGEVFKTTNGGTDWSLQYQTSNSSYEGLFFLNSNYGWVSTLQGILKTTNGGNNWTAHASELSGSPMCLRFTDIQTGWLSHNTLGSYTISKTTDGGITWINQKSESSKYVESIHFIDSNTGFAAGWQMFTPPNNSQGFVLKTTDGGVSWIEQYKEAGTINSVSFANDLIGWAVGSDGVIIYTSNGGIPVELTSFTAAANNKKVTLCWSTATETNNKGFEIERSNDKHIWEKIGFVNGHGTVTEPKNYSFEDLTIISDVYYYRLKQVDFNGDFTYSKTIEVTIGLPKEYSLSQNYPNPFNPVTTINYQIPKDGFVSLKVYDILGKEIATLVNSDKAQGKYTVEFDGSRFASGMYIYKLQSGDFVETRKMMLLK